MPVIKYLNDDGVCVPGVIAYDGQRCKTVLKTLGGSVVETGGWNWGARLGCDACCPPGFPHLNPPPFEGEATSDLVSYSEDGETATITLSDGTKVTVCVDCDDPVSTAERDDGTGTDILVDGEVVGFIPKPQITTEERADGTGTDILVDGEVVGSALDDQAVTIVGDQIMVDGQPIGTITHPDHPDATSVTSRVNDDGDTEILVDGTVIATVPADQVITVNGDDILVDGAVVGTITHPTTDPTSITTRVNADGDTVIVVNGQDLTTIPQATEVTVNDNGTVTVGDETLATIDKAVQGHTSVYQDITSTWPTEMTDWTEKVTLNVETEVPNESVILSYEYHSAPAGLRAGRARTRAFYTIDGGAEGAFYHWENHDAYSGQTEKAWTASQVVTIPEPGTHAIDIWLKAQQLTPIEGTLRMNQFRATASWTELGAV